MFFSGELSAPEKKYLCASYVRLSQDDGDKEESNSIVNQKNLIRDYLSKHPEFTLVKEYPDDGYSGVNFDRPAFQEMMEDVKNHRINCIIVKDLSRFGRNYLETGYYLQKLFPLYNLRFISVNDGYDSLTADPDSLAISMKNIVNDYYSKDISATTDA